jgi:hypothetical protein
MATPPKRQSYPELEQDLHFQHRTWTIQRLGWGVIALILLGACLGLFGHGPFSETTARDPTVPLSLDYERFGRYQSEMTLRLHVHGGAVSQGAVRIWFSGDYLSKVHIEHIMPTPETAEISPTGMTYVFRQTRPELPADIIVDLQAQTIGVISGQIGLDESHTLRFRQWIYP